MARPPTARLPSPVLNRLRSCCCPRQRCGKALPRRSTLHTNRAYSCLRCQNHDKRPG